MTNKSFRFAACLACTIVLAIANASCSIQITPSECTLENSTCNQNQYCMFATGNCGQDNATGTCLSIPDICTEIFSPVCGCDGQTYANECLAAGAGMNIQTTGECDGS